MRIDLQVLLTIVGMALVTYATRAGGLWLVNRFTLSKRVEAWLSYIPGAVLISIVAPDIVRGGPAEGVAAAATVVVAGRTNQLIAAMVVGVALVWALRTFLGWS